MTNIFHGKKVIVTGSTGFKGSWLCLWLKKMGAKVIGIGLNPEKGSIIFKSLKLDRDIKQYYLDITNFNKLDKIIKKEKPHLIYHLAAQSVVSDSYSKPLLTFNTNIIGSANILEVCRKNNIKNLVYITSDKCYINKERSTGYKESDELGGKDNYSSSKASAEIIFKSYYESYFKKGKNISKVSARAGNVIGGGDFKINRIVPDAIRALEKNKSLYLRNPYSTRPWQHVLEPLSGYIRLGELIFKKKLKKNLVPNWNFGPEKKNCKTVIHLVKTLISNWGHKIKISIKENNKLFNEANLLSLNINKSKKELNWKPTLTFLETINFTIDWYKNFFKKENMKEFTLHQIEIFEKKIKRKYD